MEHSHSETSSDKDEPVVDQSEHIADLESNLNWHAAILTVLLRKAGGQVDITADELMDIDLSRARAAVSYDEDTDTYTVKGLHDE